MKRTMNTGNFSVGFELNTKRSGRAVVEGREGLLYKIRFIETGSVNLVTRASISSGEIKDPVAPVVYGVGYVGIGEFATSDCKGSLVSYQSWKNMLSRCYDKKDKPYKYYGGVGVVVCDEWLNYQNYAQWFWENYRVGFELDKDLFFSGTKKYSPSTCVFLPKTINRLISPRKRNGLPYGVRSSNYGGYIASVRKGSKSVYLGTFDTIEEASRVYTKEKEDYIKKVADDFYKRGEITENVRDALYNWRVPEHNH